jgi:ketosteroid isomerase-like protein
MDNAAYEAFFSAWMPHLRGFRVTARETVVDEAERKVVFVASSTAESAVGPYANEYVLAFHFDDEAGRLVRFTEFVDALHSAEFFGKLEVHMKKLAGEKRAGKI